MPPAPATPRLAVLLSGSGRTLVNLQDHIDRGTLQAQIPLVIASRPCPGIDRARERNIPVLTIPGDIPSDQLQAVLTEHRIDWAILAGYLRLLHIPDNFRNRVINIHPALLPSFGGPGMYGDRVHAAVLAHGSKVSGCTVHFVDDRYDTGPIIAQQAVPVMNDDTIQTLAARVFAAECELYPRALQLVLSGRVRIEGRVTRVG